MSINFTTDNLALAQETVATKLDIFRNVAPSTCNASYSAILRYATHFFEVDKDGKPTRLVALSQQEGCVQIAGSEMEEFFATPLKNVDGSDTCLGIVLARLMDDCIQKHLQSLAVDSTPPPAPATETSTTS